MSSPLSFDETARLSTSIEAQRAEVVSETAAALLANPFWMRRFGERGRQFILQDLNYNFDFLTAAVRVASPTSLVNYYLWQREMLVARGLCTRHLHETQEETHRRLLERLPELGGPLKPFFEASRTGLGYSHPDCHALDAIELQVCEAATACMYPRPSAENLSQRRRCTQDNRYFLSYLLDAVAFNQPGYFLEMMAWIANFLTAFGVQTDDFYTDLDWLRREIEQQLPGEVEEFSALLRQLPAAS